MHIRRLTHIGWACLCYWGVVSILGFLVTGCGNTGLPNPSSRWRNTTAAHFKILFNATGYPHATLPGHPLEFGVSTEKDVIDFLQSFPILATDSVLGEAPGGKYRYIRNTYEKFTCLYRIGNENDPWKGKLFCITSFIHQNDQIRSKSSKFYQLTCSLYGQPTLMKKFRYLKKSHLIDSGIYMAVWERPQFRITCRTVYDKQNRNSISVLEFWGKGFLKEHNPIDYR